MNSYPGKSVDDLIEGVRECCRFFSCPECPLSCFGATKCPMQFILHCCSVIFDGDIERR